MIKGRTVGYIVVGRKESAAFGLGDPYENEPAFKCGLLYFGSPATLFKTRGHAQRAIERTTRYALVYGLKWNTEDMIPQRVVA